MEELFFKIVRMHGPRDEVIARVQNFLICKAAFEKALCSFIRMHTWRCVRGRGSF